MNEEVQNVMDWKDEGKPFGIILAVFFVAFFLPLEIPRFTGALMEALQLVKWYAREHVVLCLVPAFFIAGAISVFLSQAAVMKYLGATARRVVAYPVAAVSGSILAVCSCTILPLFAGIYKRGAGLGPASAFLYSGPAINVLAIILTSRVLGLEIGIARAIGAILFSIVIGIFMELIFRKEELAKQAAAPVQPIPDEERPLGQTIIYFALMVLILVFANWGKPQESSGVWYFIHSSKWIITSVLAAALAVVLVAWYRYSLWRIALTGAVAAALAFIFPQYPALSFSAGFFGIAWVAWSAHDEGEEWISSSWGYAKQIMPLLFYGVLFAGFLLGSPKSRYCCISDSVFCVHAETTDVFLFSEQA